MASALEQMVAGLVALGMPVAYGQFVNTHEHPAPSLPYITYQYAYDAGFKADNTNYLSVGVYQIELYTKTKDTVKEGLVESKLKQLGLTWAKVSAWLESETCWQTVYDVHLIGG